MITKDTVETHKTLQELQKQLNRLNSATQQIEEVKEISVNVTQNMLELQMRYQNHLDFLKDDHQKSAEKLNEILRKQLEENFQAQMSLIENTDSKIAEVNSVFQNNIIKSEKIQEEQLESINESHIQLIANAKTEIAAINSVFESNIMKSERIQLEQHAKITEHLKIYDNFIDDVRNLTTTIEKVDFPNRLDKLDNTVSSINLGIQNTQTVLATIEKRLSDKLDNQKDVMLTQFERTAKANKFIKISVWVIGGISIFLLLGLSFVLFKKLF